MSKKNLLPDDTPSIENNDNDSIGLIDGQKNISPTEGVNVSDPATEAKRQQMQEVRKKLQDAYKEPVEERTNPLTGEKIEILKSEIEARHFTEETKKEAVIYKIIGGIFIGIIILVFVALLSRYVLMLLGPIIGFR